MTSSNSKVRQYSTTPISAPPPSQPNLESRLNNLELALASIEQMMRNHSKEPIIEPEISSVRSEPNLPVEMSTNEPCAEEQKTSVNQKLQKISDDVGAIRSTQDCILKAPTKLQTEVSKLKKLQKKIMILLARMIQKHKMIQTNNE